MTFLALFALPETPFGAGGGGGRKENEGKIKFEAFRYTIS